MAGRGKAGASNPNEGDSMTEHFWTLAELEVMKAEDDERVWSYTWQIEEES